eukprot:3086735-Rhodomonas_salina.4
MFLRPPEPLAAQTWWEQYHKEFIAVRIHRLSNFLVVHLRADCSARKTDSDACHDRGTPTCLCSTPLDSASSVATRPTTSTIKFGAWDGMVVGGAVQRWNGAEKAERVERAVST